MSKGSIKVNTENLLPIIKKWLYSDKDSITEVKDAVQHLTKEFGSVFTTKKIPEKATFGKLFRIEKGEVNIIEDNA